MSLKEDSLMSKKKNKFDLTSLVHDGYLKEGDTISFVSDPAKTAKVVKILNGEFKLTVTGTPAPVTVHAFAQTCLGQEPPDHAAKWFKGPNGKTLYEIWQSTMEEAA